MIKIIKAAWINFQNSLAYNAEVRDTMKQLRQLSDKELNDIGISRGEIWDVAHSVKRPAKVEADDIQVNANIKGWV